MEKEFDDLVYEAWRRGRNPDLVSADRYDDRRAQGYYPDEITLDMVLPKRKKREDEEE
jgi:hypothetical protein